MALQSTHSSTVSVSRPCTRVALNDSYVIVPSVQANQLEIRHLDHAQSRPLVLTHLHDKPVTAMDIIKVRNTSLVCTASRDKITVWSVEQIINNLNSFACIPSNAIVEHVKLDETGTLLSVCTGNNVVVYELKTYNVLALLEGHTAKVNASAFALLEKKQAVITISEDRTFKVWDLTNHTILYSSSIISPSPFSSICFDKTAARFAIGSEDGKVRVYEMALHGCRHLTTIDLTSELRKLKLQTSALTSYSPSSPSLPTSPSPSLASSPSKYSPLASESFSSLPSSPKLSPTSSMTTLPPHIQPLSGSGSSSGSPALPLKKITALSGWKPTSYSAPPSPPRDVGETSVPVVSSDE